MSHISSPTLSEAQAAALNVGWLIRVDGEGFAVRQIGSLTEQHTGSLTDALQIVREGTRK